MKIQSLQVDNTAKRDEISTLENENYKNNTEKRRFEKKCNELMKEREFSKER